VRGKVDVQPKKRCEIRSDTKKAFGYPSLSKERGRFSRDKERSGVPG